MTPALAARVFMETQLLRLQAQLRQPVPRGDRVIPAPRVGPFIANDGLTRRGGQSGAGMNEEEDARVVSVPVLLAWGSTASTD